MTFSEHAKFERKMMEPVSNDAFKIYNIYRRLHG